MKMMRLFFWKNDAEKEKNVFLQPQNEAG